MAAMKFSISFYSASSFRIVLHLVSKLMFFGSMNLVVHTRGELLVNKVSDFHF